MRKKTLFFLLILYVLCIPLSAYAGMLENLPLGQGSFSGDVVALQQRLIDLGYLHFRASGSFGDMTKAAVRAFQKRNDLSSTGIVDEETYYTLFFADCVRARANASISCITGPVTVAEPPAYGVLTGWQEIALLFPVGTRAEVTDLYTGYTYTVVRAGGANHADVRPLVQSDYKTYLKCFGGAYTWEKRPALVEIGGVQYAASVFGTPNANGYAGEGSSDMEGSICVYFYESTSDIGGIADVEHDTNVLLASAGAGIAK